MKIDQVLCLDGMNSQDYAGPLAVISNATASRKKWRDLMRNAPLARCRSFYTQYNSVLPLSVAQDAGIPYVTTGRARRVTFNKSI